MNDAETDTGTAGTAPALGSQRDQEGCQWQGNLESAEHRPDVGGCSDPSAVQIHVLAGPSPSPQKVPDYLGCSIFAMMFCFLPLGIAALIYSMKTWSANRAGTTAAAKRNLMISRQLNIGAVLIGLIVHFVWVARLIMTLIEHS